MKYLLIVSSIAVICVAVFASTARATECDKMTYLTFSAPVGLPGVTLPPGTYRFSHPDCDMSSRVLTVSSEDGTEVYATLLTIPEERVTTSDKPEVLLAEMPAGYPEVIQAWFYPGETVGDELVYPKSEQPIVGSSASDDVVVESGR